MKSATIKVHGDGAIWRGSLREFFRVNEYSLEDARPIIAELRSRGRTLIGGGAAPVFRLWRVQ